MIITAKRIKKGEYIYRGFIVKRFGYYEPEKRVVWEGIDKNTGDGEAHGYTKREVMAHIDDFLDKK